MVATDKVFAGSIPEIYDRFLVPLIFEPYARDLADACRRRPLPRRAGDRRRHRRPDARAGGAAPARRAHRRDRPQPADARSRRRRGSPTAGSNGSRPTRWRCRSRTEASSRRLPVRRDVLSRQGPGLPEARRVLKPGGRFFFNVWDRIAENEFADVVTEALADGLSRTIRRASWRARRTAITTSSRSARELDAGRLHAISRSRRVDASQQGRRRRAIPRSPTARARRCGTRSRRATPRGWKRRPSGAAEAVAQRFGNGAVEGRIRAFVITAVR